MAESLDDSERNREPQGQGYDSDDWDLSRYINELELYAKETQPWSRRCKLVVKRYQDDRGGDGKIENQERRFNVLWSNTQNLMPALYSRNPKPDVQRRFKDDDPIGRVASDVLERCITYFCDTDGYASTNRAAVLDYLLPGRGVSWIRYVPHFKPGDPPVAQITDDKTDAGDQNEDQASVPDVIDYEEVIVDYVNREDFGHNICRTWDECWLVWRKVYMTRQELKARFMKPFMEKLKLSEQEAEFRINSIPLDYKRQDQTGKVIDDGVSKAVIYEAWDKIRRNAIWFSQSMPDKKALDCAEDPLRLSDFFPCPRPMLANLVNESLIPIPFYCEYQDQAQELDLLTARISLMTRCLKVVGVKDSSAEGIDRMFNEGTENELIPVQNWSLFNEKGGLDGAMQLLPLKDIVDAITGAYQAREQVKKDLDEITGMSDIIRGETNPNESATAQQLKSSYATSRISDYQREVQRFVRNSVRIMGEIICTHFQPETIMAISGVRLLTKAEKAQFSQSQAPAPAAPVGAQPGPVAPPPVAGLALPPGITQDQMQQMMNDPTWEEVISLMRNNASRSFRIDIETDSIIKADEMQEKQDRVEFLQATSAYLDKAVQAGQVAPELIPLMGRMLMFGIKGFSVGKELESSFEAFIHKMELQAQQPKPPKPDPEMMKIQGQMQLEQAKMQNQIEVQKAQLAGDQQAEAARLASQERLEQFKAQSQAQTDQRENELEFQRKLAEMEQAMSLERMKLQSTEALEISKARIQQETAIAVARINAGATTGEQEESIAYAGDRQASRELEATP